jgi:hypothetical protein
MVERARRKVLGDLTPLRVMRGAWGVMRVMVLR